MYHLIYNINVINNKFQKGDKQMVILAKISVVGIRTRMDLARKLSDFPAFNGISTHDIIKTIATCERDGLLRVEGNEIVLLHDCD